MNLDWRDIAGHPIDVQLYVSNLANKVYVSGGESYLGLDKGTYGDPRFYGIRVKYRYGKQ
jgi:iron complex outermembrane receptor protein